MTRDKPDKKKRPNVVWLPVELAKTLGHMASELVGAPVLLGGIVAALLASTVVSVLYHRPTLLLALVNYLLLLIYAIVVRVLTRDARPPPARVRWPRSELSLYLVVAAWIGFFAFSTEIPYLSDALERVTGAGLRLLGAVDPVWAMQYQVGVWIFVHVLVIPWLVWTLIRYRPGDLGLRPRLLRVAAALIVLGALPALGELAANDPRATVMSGVGAFVIATALIGLPGEFFDRGLLLPRLEAIMKNRLDALAVAAFIVSLGEVPSLVRTGSPTGAIVAHVASGFGDPFNLALGYLFLRTRSVWPGALWRAAAATISVAFI